MNLWKQFEIAFYIGVALLLLYRPPKVSSGLQGVVGFIERHFGDSIGLYLLHLGIALIVLGDVFQHMTNVGKMGESLILAAMSVLKLKTVPGGNGNGSTTEVVSTTRTTDPPPLPGSDTPPGNIPAADPPQTPAQLGPPPSLWPGKS